MAAEYRFGLLRAGAAANMPAFADNFDENPTVPELLARFAHMDYLLLHGVCVVETVAVATNLTRVAESGGWILLRRDTPIAPQLRMRRPVGRKTMAATPGCSAGVKCDFAFFTFFTFC